MTDLTIYIALLRGINLGRHNKLPMGELTALFEDAGCRDVRTYVQSGNVLFCGTAELATRLPPALTATIAGRYGYQVPVVIRSEAELLDVVARNPYADIGADPRFVQVAFLAKQPSAESVASLDPNRSPPDRFTVSGREVFLHFAHGTARSKISNAYLERVLRVPSTMRNWRTVTTLAEMAAEATS